MMEIAPGQRLKGGAVGMKATVLLAIGAVGAFHVAYEYRALAGLMLGFLWCLFELGRVATTRVAFWTGLLIGLGIFGPQLAFFWRVLGTTGIAAWLILSLWMAVFLLVSRGLWGAAPRVWWVVAVPVLWMGLEYFRCELYYFRFSWLNVGFAFWEAAPVRWLGVYGVGLVLMGVVAGIRLLPWKVGVVVGVLALGGVIWLGNLRPEVVGEMDRGLPYFVGIQMEYPPEEEVVVALEQAIGRHPQAEVLILSEYTYGGPPPAKLLEWCAGNRRYVIVGGVKPKGETGAWWDTAFVVDPEGRVVFEQAKSVPIQFMNDGLPAEKQAVWESPWGKIGICVCYDLSYSRVTDRLIGMGAGMIIAPSMDLIRWGEHEHWLHEHVGPARAAEYGLPVIRVCSSGVSQVIDANGAARASVPFPGQGEEITGRLAVKAAGGRVPWDRYVAPLCSMISGVVAVGLLVRAILLMYQARPAALRKASSPSMD